MRLKGAMFRPRRGECDVGKTDPRRHGNGLPFGRWHRVGGVVHALSTPTVLNQTRRGGERVDNPIDDLGQWRLSVHGAASRAAIQHAGPFETGDVPARRVRTIGQVVAFPEVNGSVIDPAPRFPPPAHRRFVTEGSRPWTARGKRSSPRRRPVRLGQRSTRYAKTEATKSRAVWPAVHSVRQAFLGAPPGIKGTALAGLSTLCPRRRSSINRGAVGMRVDNPLDDVGQALARATLHPRTV